MVEMIGLVCESLEISVSNQCWNSADWADFEIGECSGNLHLLTVARFDLKCNWVDEWSNQVWVVKIVQCVKQNYFHSFYEEPQQKP